MKKIVLGLVCLLCISTTNFAQTKEELQAQRVISLEQMTTAGKQIGLEEKQITKLKGVFEDLFKSVDQIKADSTLTPEVRKEKLKEANGKKDWKVQNILGDKYKAYGEARKKIIADAAATKKQ